MTDRLISCDDLSFAKTSSDSLGSILRSTGKTPSLVGGRATGILRPSGLRWPERRRAGRVACLGGGEGRSVGC